MGEGLYAKFFGGGTQEKELDKPATGPIVACIGPEKSFSFKERNQLEGLKPIPVDYYGTAESWERLEQKNGGIYSYVISRIDAENKFSGEYQECTGIAAVGFESKTGKNISLLTHQAPGSILDEGRAEFREHLTERLKEFAARTDMKDVDVVVFGGSASEDYSSASPERKEGAKAAAYRESIQMLREIVHETLNFDPHVVAGPNMNTMWNGKEIRVILDTGRRRLYVIRPIQPGLGTTNVGFPASQLEEQEQHWKSKK